MPIAAVNQAVDARGVALLLAQAAQGFLGEDGRQNDRERALNNVYRLLKLYRAQSKFQVEPPTVSTPLGKYESVVLMPLAERNVGDVTDAMTGALVATFGSQSQENLDQIEKVLQGVAYPAEFPAPTQPEREAAKNFFEALVRRLNISA